MFDFKSFFETELCDISTQAYMLEPNFVDVLFPLISSRLQSEIKNVRTQLLLGSAPCTPIPYLRVAFSNVAMDSYAGSELWTADMAKYLKSVGIDVIVYTPIIGAVANMLKEVDIEVTSSPDRVEMFGPTILHVNHFDAALPLIERMEGKIPIINVVHGLLPRPELPGYKGVDKYCCVSIAGKAKIHVLTGTEWEHIETLPNFFDERRFVKLSTFAGANKAALLSSRTSPEQRDKLQAAISALGFQLEHIGYGSRPTPNPEEWLAGYDLIFAVGRSAIEALASGAHVILWDSGIIGPAVTSDNFWKCVTSNFSLPANVLEWTFIDRPEAMNWITEQVNKICASSRLETARLTRTYLPLSSIGNKIVQMYTQQLKLYNTELR
jgi:hypothetical protein